MVENGESCVCDDDDTFRLDVRLGVLIGLTVELLPWVFKAGVLPESLETLETLEGLEGVANSSPKSSNTKLLDLL